MNEATLLKDLVESLQH